MGPSTSFFKVMTGLKALACQPFSLYFGVFSFITPLLLVVVVWNVTPTYWKSWAVNVMEGLGLTLTQGPP